jgi:acetyl esterase/lipase
MSSFRAKIIRSITSAYIKRIDIRNADFVKIRLKTKWLGRLLIKAFRVRVQKDQINGLYAEWLTPKNCMDGKLLLYLHGGAYVIGGCDMHRQLVSHIARAGRIRTLVPEYRLSPEHKFPAAIDDAVAIYRSLLDMGMKPQDIIIAGDSAGGGLTVATLLALRDAGDPLPAAAVPAAVTRCRREPSRIRGLVLTICQSSLITIVSHINAAFRSCHPFSRMWRGCHPCLFKSAMTKFC